MMNVLVIGSGGREHAICESIYKSKHLDRLFCLPGNPGIAELAECISGNIMDNEFIVSICKEKSIDFVIVGPEAPLANGLINRLNDAHIHAFGPTQSAAELESSKIFMKYLCKQYSIPTAKSSDFINADDAKSYIESQAMPIVVKANGLAAGKGVFIAHNKSEAFNAIDDMLLHKKFGSAGDSIIIEEFLEGREASFFVLSDGDTVISLGFAQDYKPIFDGNKGPNTGGMGSYSPVNFIDVDIELKIKNIALQTINAMKEEGRPYKGVLYLGLMLTDTGAKLLEYNVRFGDPECQVIFPRIKNDILDVLLSVSKGELNKFSNLELDNRSVICIVLASPGYPANPQIGSEIIIKNNKNILHAGTEKKNGKIYSKGGRVLNIIGIGKNLSEARSNAYDSINEVEWKDMYYRNDIGLIENE